jgi:trehalose-phosphatase
MGGELVVHDGLDVLESRLRRLAESIPGSEVEVKRSSVAFHYRNVKGDLEDLLTRVLEMADEWPEVKVLSGKMVVEMSLSARTKGDAISELTNGVARILYVGDDTTDETVFQVLGPDDVGVKVGEGDTAAGYRVDVVDEVADLLVFLAGEVESGSGTGGEQA